MAKARRRPPSARGDDGRLQVQKLLDSRAESSGPNESACRAVVGRVSPELAPSDSRFHARCPYSFRRKDRAKRRARGARRPPCAGVSRGRLGRFVNLRSVAVSQWIRRQWDETENPACRRMAGRSAPWPAGVDVSGLSDPGGSERTRSCSRLSPSSPTSRASCWNGSPRTPTASS